jgi:hypothetical protein
VSLDAFIGFVLQVLRWRALLSYDRRKASGKNDRCKCDNVRRAHWLLFLFDSLKADRIRAHCKKRSGQPSLIVSPKSDQGDVLSRYPAVIVTVDARRGAHNRWPNQ